ncbi:MAG: hypothetical protein ACK44D_09430, partial [Bacteroidia bacterium]
MYEQQQINNANNQLQQGYEKTQRIIRAKELGFVELIQNELVMDTLNLQRNWSSLTKLVKTEKCNLFITQNDTLKFWSDNEINYKQIKFKENSYHNFIKAPNGWYLVYKQNRGTYTYVFTYLVKHNFAYKNQHLQNKFNQDLSFLEDA